MTRTTITTVVFFITLSIKSIAQTINYNNTLPVDTTIKKGVLPNGMTYYIKSTDVVKDAASYYIIQNVGSILENDDQQGLAHFLEHMAFNGTESFPGKGILNTLQKYGAVFGKDINAYTSFDETVYNLSKIPTKDSLVDTCLTILKDWSNYLLLTDDEIDAERGVIKEEWRTRQSGQMRVFTATLPITFNHSKYADRMPIGLMSIVENFDYDALRNFYHDWYRTDLQAIAVIGDIDAEVVEKKIVEKFSKIPAVENPRTRFIVDIPDSEDMQYGLATDPEVSTASISFGIRHKKSMEEETVAHLKQSLLKSMATSMLSERISELSQKESASFLGANVGYGSLSRTSKQFSIRIAPKPNQQKEAFKEVMTEVIRAVKFGYTPSEIDRTIAKLKTSYENQISQKDDVSHSRIARTIQNDYLNKITMSDVENEYAIAKQIFKTLSAEDFHQTIKRLYTEDNRYLNVTGVEGQDNLTEAEAKAIIESLETDATIEPYTEDLAGKTLMSDINIKSGSIKNEKTNKDLGSTTFILSNGIKVHHKFVEKEKDNVSLNAVSYGGNSLLKDEELPSASMVGYMIQFSGLGDFNATDLKKVLAGKTASVNINLSDIKESLSGNSNTKDVETMLQLVYLYFVKPRFDEQAFNVLKNNIDNYIIRRSKDVNEQIKDSLTVTIYGKNNPKEHIFNEDYASKISFQKAKDIYNSRFADASDFEFFIVGDLKADQLKPLLTKYLASIPTKNFSESFSKNQPEWVSNDIDKDVYIAMEDPKARINMAYVKEMPYSEKNKIATNALGDILQLRILETVRESEGGAYSPRANAYFSREPKSQAVLSISFDCNPELADKLVDIVDAEVQKIANGTIKDEDLSKTKTNFIKEREQSKDKNSYDMTLLMQYFRYGLNINNPKNFENIVNNLSKEEIKDITKQLIEGGKSYEIIFKPKQ